LPATAGATINPSYLARTDFVFEQPLWQSFGVDINQLLNRTPGVSPASSLSQAAQTALNNSPFQSQQGNSAGFGSDGILISRLRFDQSRADFERAVNFQALNVEAAYWNLYSAYVNLYAAEQGLRLAHIVWVQAESKKKVGAKALITEARARGQFFLFKGDRNDALGQVLEAERVLRTLMGLKPDDGEQLIPCDAPTTAPYIPDWCSALEEAINLRPELIALRQEVKLRQLDMELQKNFLKPDLRFVSRYGISGLGSTLTGPGTEFDATTGQFRPAAALRNLATTNFSDWNLGLTLNVPLGYRYEHASLRRARLALAQAGAALASEENKAQSYLTKTYRDLFEKYRSIADRRAQREGFANDLEFILDKARKGEDVNPEEMIQSQRDYVNALRQESQAVSVYNTSLAAFQFAKGTLLRHDNIVINEGELPQCAGVRAVAHEEERSKAIVVRERANPVSHGPLAPEQGCWGLPTWPSFTAPSLPALQEGAAMLDGQIAAQSAAPAATAQGGYPVPKTTPMPSATPLPGNYAVPTLPAPVQPNGTMASPVGPQANAAPVPLPSPLAIAPNVPAPPAAPTVPGSMASTPWIAPLGAAATPALPTSPAP
jgi:outer membrane protein TolC